MSTCFAPDYSATVSCSQNAYTHYHSIYIRFVCINHIREIKFALLGSLVLSLVCDWNTHTNLFYNIDCCPATKLSPIFGKSF
jgi:hypothetical protein